jgi:hypothetical protein
MAVYNYRQAGRFMLDQKTVELKVKFLPILIDLDTVYGPVLHVSEQKVCHRLSVGGCCQVACVTETL